MELLESLHLLELLKLQELLKIWKRWITRWLTIWNQEMLAHLKITAKISTLILLIPDPEKKLNTFWF